MPRHHDSLWKGLLQAFFPDFLDWAVPEVSAQLLSEQSRFLEQEAFTDPPDGQQALLDLVAEVPARNGPDQLVVVHVEIEREFGAAMDRRMWRYFAHLALKYPHAILPIVLFLRGGEGGLTRRSFEHRVGDILVNRFSYFSLALANLEAKELLDRAPLGVALATCARKDRLPKEEQRYLCMEAMLKSDVDGAAEQLLLTSIETYLKLNEEEKMKYAERMSRSPYQAELREKELTWAGELHEKGRREGRREGLEVAQRLLLNIVSRRFGEPPTTLSETIRRLEDPSRLEALSDRALTAADLAEFEASLIS